MEATALESGCDSGDSGDRGGGSDGRTEVMAEAMAVEWVWQSWMTMDRRGGRHDCRRVVLAAMVEEPAARAAAEQASAPQAVAAAARRHAAVRQEAVGLLPISWLR